MSFRDCILGKIEAGVIKGAKGEALLKKFDAMTERFKSQGTSEDAARLAAEKLLEAEATIIEKRQRNLKTQAVKQAAWNAWADATPGTMAAKVKDTLQRAAWRGEAVRAEGMAYLNQVADKLQVNYAGLSRDHNVVVEAVRHILDGKTTDPNAAKVGEAISEVMRYFESRYARAGGIMGKIENYFPQTTRKEALQAGKVTRDQFVEQRIAGLDISKMIDEDTGVPFEIDKLKEITGEIYDYILTNGRSRMERDLKAGKVSRQSGGDVDVRRIEARFFKFKNADAFLADNAKFGFGEKGLAMALFDYMGSMSRDIGTMETMGPKSNAMMRFMDLKMQIDPKSAPLRKWANADYRVLTSSFQHGDIDSTWWKAFTAGMNWMRAAKMGSAAISALSDTAYIPATAMVNGLDATRALKFYIKNVLPIDNANKAIIRRNGLIAEKLMGMAIGETRFAGEAMGGTFTKTMANLTIDLSGLSHLTKTTQDSVTLEGMATLGDYIKAGTYWKDVNEDLRASLGRFGFTEDDWGHLSKATVVENGELNFLVTSELRVDKSINAVTRNKIADKIDDWTMMMRQMAANEPLIATRALTTGAILGDGGLNTPSRYFGSAVGLFKSFPITSILSHLVPAVKRAATQRKFDHLAFVLIGTTILGATVQQIKAALGGKTPKDMNDPDFIKASFLQGGGMGLFGDFLFGDYSRFGRSPMTEIGGPMWGLADDLLSATAGNLDKESGDVQRNVSRDLFRIAKGNIPLGNLWYTRLAMERLVLDNLERMIDPGFDKRIRKYEKKMRKETGQEFWWRPGQNAPK